jgi:hypothetical protein
MSSPRGKKKKKVPALPFWSQEQFWLLLGCLGGAFWFYYNYSLPPLLKGRLCCDSLEYITLTNKLTSWTQAFSDYSAMTGHYVHRTMGYPVFLYLHKQWVALLDIPMDWVDLSLFTNLALHFASSVFLFRSLKYIGMKIHPIALFLLLVHPGLTSHAALALTDSLAASLFMLIVGCLARTVGRTDKGALGYAAAAGLLAGFAVLVRPSLSTAVMGFFAFWAVWLAVRVLRQKLSPKRRWSVIVPLATVPLVFIASYGVGLQPQYSLCEKAFGTRCFLKPGYIDEQMMNTLEMGVVSARWYSLVGSRINANGLIKVPDDLMVENYASVCIFKTETVKKDLIHCYWSNIGTMPFYIGKKLVGLFDNFHLNTYSTYVTSPTVLFVNRAFGVAAFVGFMICLFLFGKNVVKFEDPIVLLLGLPVFYVVLSTIPHVESRYGFPAVPFAIFAIVALTERILKQGPRRSKWQLAAAAAAALAFLIQVHEWDLKDPMKYENIDEYR